MTTLTTQVSTILTQGDHDASNTKSIWDNLILDEWEIPFGEWADQSVDWISVNLEQPLDIVAWPFDILIQFLVRQVLSEVSWIWVVLAMFLIASLVKNLKVGVFVAGALTLCGLLGGAYWVETARTIGFIGVAVILCVIIGIPIGILCGRVGTAWRVVRPILDAMQVVHSFVYMLPFIFFWGIGEVSATMVTMVFALPPLIRLTNLGIRQVPADVVEAARAYGASERRVLFDVQIPLARPAIMTGINQTLLLSISMLGIAAIMGAGGLGRLLFRALSNQDVALAASAGLAFFLVAVVLDRMSQREDSDTGNLLRRIALAWAHRRNPEALIPAPDTSAVVVYKEEEQFAPLAIPERLPMALALVGSVTAVVSVFLPWSIDAGKLSAYGRRVDENLEGMSFSGLDASGGSWFGVLVLLLGLWVTLSVLASARRPGRTLRWLTAEGTTLGSVGMFLASLAFLLSSPVTATGSASVDAIEPSTGLGVIIATFGSAVALLGAFLWLRVAPHAPLHPLRAVISWSRLGAVVAAAVMLTIGMVAGWSFDQRADVVITADIDAEIQRLRAEAEERPEDVGAISAQISTVMAAASQTTVIVTDGVGDESSGLGLIVLIGGLVALVTNLPAIGLFGMDEHVRWQWSTVTAAIGVGVAAIALAWVVTHARSADPNFFSGIGAFLAFCGGVVIVASTLPVLKEFRRSRIYDDTQQGSNVIALTERDTVKELV